MVKYLIDIGIEQKNLKGDVSLIRALKEDNKAEMAEDNRNVYNLYLQKEDWNQAEKFTLKSLAISEEIKDYRNVCADCRILTNIYVEKKERSKQEIYYNKALENSRILNDPKEILIDLRYLGKFNMERGYREKAGESFHQAFRETNEK